MKTFHLEHGILIVGGGRWAKVIIRNLMQIISDNSRIKVYTKNCSKELQEWIALEGFSSRIQIFNSIELDQISKVNAENLPVIVVNSPRDHIKFTSWALLNDANVLVEKPFSTSIENIQPALSIESSSRGKICLAHVFKYSQAVENFKQLMPKLNDIQSISIEWQDPEIEIRNGDLKRHDRSIPIYLDLLPHIVSILHSLWNQFPTFEEILYVKYGGANIGLNLSLAGLPCNILLSRNSKKRLRKITIKTNYKSYYLDFSDEPGKITTCSGKKLLSLQSKMTPIQKLLSSFLDFSLNGILDPNLDLETGICSLSIADQIRDEYEKQVIDSFAEALFSRRRLTKSEFYSIAEILQKNKRLTDSEIRYKIKIIRSRLNQLNFSRLNELTAEKILLFSSEEPYTSA